MIPLALMLAVSASAATPPADPQAYQQALAKARAAFLSQAPGQPTLDAVVRLPPPPAEKAPNDPVVRTALSAARDVQLGCERPCADPADVQVYAGQVELVARRLGLAGAQVDAALKHYIPGGKPRLRGAAAGAQTPEGRAVKAEVLARLLAESRLAPQMRERLNRKALAMAEALGRTPTISADASGIVTLPDGSRGRMSAAQLAALNRLPRSQAAILRTLVTNPPPPPLTPQQKQDRILAQADKEIAAHPGTVGSAYNYWADEAKNPNNGWLWRHYASLNKGLLKFSGLKSVEESSARLGWVWDNPDVSKGEKFWLGTKLAGNAALTAVSFLPAASFAKSLQAGEGFYWIGKGGAAVPGMVRAATPEAAEAMGATERTLATTIAETVPEGTKVGKEGLRELATNMNKATERYGVRIIEGGTSGESVAKGGDVFVSLDVGGQHEMVHGVQQVYSRALAVQEMATRLGVPVESLSAAQRAEAFANAARWEGASYAQLESQAWRATGFMGSGGGARYGGQLLLTGREVATGMRNGAVLDGSFGLGARAYGRLTQILGHSQAQIGLGVGSAFAGTMNTSVGDGPRDLLDQLASRYTAPAAAPAADAGARFLRAATPAPGALFVAPAVDRLILRPAAAPRAP